ncbi:MAG TPA: hypothetical protein QF686_07310, partial [Nitrosopumilus sp.]|nr:hypothetical protein [Nitrosopumilus sp.]
MKKWADFLISEVTYDLDHKISIIKRHSETESGITPGIEIDRLNISSDIQSGFSYVTIYKSGSTWKLGNKLNSFRIGGDYFLRIDKNIAKLDYLGDLPEVEFIDDEIDSALEEKLNKLSTQLETKPVQEKPVQEKPVQEKPVQEKPVQEKPVQEKPVQEKPVQEKPVQNFEEYEKDYLLRLVKKKLEKEIQQLKLDLAPEPETPSSSRGSLPKDSQEELPQELDLAPEPEPETPSSSRGSLPKDSQEELPQELDLAPEPEEDISEQLSKVDKLEQEINKLRSNELEQSKKIDSLQKQLEKFELFEKQIESLDLYKETIEKQITQLIKNKSDLIQPEPEEDISEQLSRIEELEKQIEVIESQPETPSSSRGSLPKDSQEELPQELDLAPEPEPE